MKRTNLCLNALKRKFIIRSFLFEEIGQNQSWSMYHISTAYPDCRSGDDVYVAQHQALQVNIKYPDLTICEHPCLQNHEVFETVL